MAVQTANWLGRLVDVRSETIAFLGLQTLRFAIVSFQTFVSQKTGLQTSSNWLSYHLLYLVSFSSSYPCILCFRWCFCPSRNKQAESMRLELLQLLPWRDGARPSSCYRVTLRPHHPSAASTALADELWHGDAAQPWSSSASCRRLASDMPWPKNVLSMIILHIKDLTISKLEHEVAVSSNHFEYPMLQHSRSTQLH
jgi:hypothetical protein